MNAACLKRNEATQCAQVYIAIASSPRRACNNQGCACYEMTTTNYIPLGGAGRLVTVELIIVVDND